MAFSGGELAFGPRQVVEELLSQLLLLRLQAQNAGDLELIQLCRRSERDLRRWLERR